MTLSAAQKRAVERTGQDVCAVAGPGSGKTRTLVERFAWLVERGTAPGRILAITFTEKAAREIKSRLVTRFAAREDWRAEIERAPVSTIHGLCQRLLRENAIEAGLDPEFEILDELEAATEKSRAMEEALDRAAFEQREEFRLLADAWAGQDFAGPLLGLYETIRSGDWGGVLELARAPDPAPILTEIEEEALRGAEAAARGTDAVRERGAKMRAFARAREDRDPLEWLGSFQVDKKAKNAALAASVDAIRMRMKTARQAVLAARHTPRRELLRAIVLDFHERYSARKMALARVDFHDLEERAIALLEGGRGLRADLAEQYEAILMDELQDTNPVQWRLVNLLRRPGRFFAVGDLNQSIYGFRHAEPGLFREYRAGLERAGSAVDELGENYRSRPEILAAVARLGERLRGLDARNLEAKGVFPPKAGPSVELLRVEGEADEAEWIARRIGELSREYGYRWGDFAVLARKKNALAEVEGALARAGVPCVAQRGEPFFEQTEVVDLVNWLKVVEEPGDETAAAALLRSPFYGVGDEEIFRLRREGATAPPEIAAEWARLREARAETPAGQLLGLHLDASGYLDGLGARGRANVEKFLRLLTRWEEAAPGSPGTWLEEIGRMRARGEEAAAAPAGAEDAVTLMSIHGAKGLEFKVVFVTRLERGTRRDADPVDWTREEGLGFAWRDPRDDEAVPDPALERIRMARADREAEEAGRLLYVAATRAEDHLVFTWRTPERGAPAWVAAVEGAFGFDPNLPAGEAVAREGIRYLRATQPAGEPAVSEAVAGAPEEELLDRMEAQPARGSGYAVTAVGRYLQCPRQWMLDQAALPEEEEEAEGARFGSVVHALLAGEEPGEATEAERAYAARFAGSPLGWRMAAARRVEREYDFLFAFEESVFRGRIDLWFEEADGRRIVVDYKTGKRPDAETLEAYRTQLRLYRRAVPGGADELWLAFLGDRSEEQVEGEAGDGLLRAFLDGTARGEYPMRPGEGCGPCRHFGGLCRPEGGE